MPTDPQTTRRRRRRPLPIGAIGPWRPGYYMSACWGDVEQSPGRIHAGLAMSFTFAGSPKGRRPPVWTLTHLGSGHVVCNIEAHEAEAFAIATEIAECGDWDFDGLKGYLNRDPDLPEKFRALMQKHGKRVVRSGGGRQSEAAAMAISMARA